MKHSDRRTDPAAPTCWQREAPCACLRIEASPREIHLFPYQHLVSATLSQADTTEMLRLAFSSHDVEISGHNLRALVLALQDFAVKWMRSIPDRYQRLDSSEDGTISRITIREAS